MTDEQMLAWIKTQYDFNEGGCWVWKNCINRGYGIVRWKNKNWFVHQLYWLLSGRIIPDGYDICHAPNICHNRACFNLEHLRTDTRANNQLDRHADETANNKLTQDQVRAIRADTRSLRVIAKEYGVVHKTILRIKTGKSWGWLSDSPE
jgi:hypothetical protein